MQILSVNVGASRPVDIKGRTIQTGIYKTPVNGPVAVSRFGLQDDVRIEKRKMGLEHSAVYAYPYEHYAYWQNELACDPFPMGQFGENLTVTGLLEEEVRIGDIFRFGNTVLQVAHPRIPCAKLNARMGLRFASMFLESCKVGYYLRVLEEGTVSEGDSIELLERDDDSPSMEEFVRVTHYEFWDELALQKLLKARDLMSAWRENIEGKIARAQSATGWHGLRDLEVVRREQESEDAVSLFLNCAKGRELSSFHAGQKLMVALGGRSSRVQQRFACYLSSSPRDLSTYRITVSGSAAKGQSELKDNVPMRPEHLNVGDHVLCNSPHGSAKSLTDQAGKTCPHVLITQGLGIAPILSLLYELEGQSAQVVWFHEVTDNDPQLLLNEADALVDSNPNFKKCDIGSEVLDHNKFEQVLIDGSSELENIHIAGSRSYIERMTDEFVKLDISSSSFVGYRID